MYLLKLKFITKLTNVFLFQIQLTFKTFSLQKPNECESNFVDVFSDKTDIPSRNQNFCGSMAETVPSNNNTMFVRFFAEPQAFKSEFRALFTEFKDIDKNAGKLE